MKFPSNVLVPVSATTECKCSGPQKTIDVKILSLSAFRAANHMENKVGSLKSNIITDSLVRVKIQKIKRTGREVDIRNINASPLVELENRSLKRDMLR